MATDGNSISRIIAGITLFSKRSSFSNFRDGTASKDVIRSTKESKGNIFVKSAELKNVPIGDAKK
jgi:hypothetical protein